MTTYVALLRGINLGPRNKVPMAELRETVAALGHSSVRTHLNSGNAVFTAAQERNAEAVAEELSTALADRFGLTVPVLVRTVPHLRAVVEANPYPEGGFEGSRLHVTFYDGPVDAERFSGIDAAALGPDDYRLGDRVLYLRTPEGLGRSRLAAELARPARTRGLIATTRTWNTVVKLLAMARESEGN